MSINELLVSAYLEHVLACDVVETQVQLSEHGAVIDVLGVNTQSWTVYACAVENHLLSPLGSSHKHVNNSVTRCVEKFRKMIASVNYRYEGFTAEYMLWTPVVSDDSSVLNRNPSDTLKEIITLIKIDSGVDVEAVSDEQFLFRLKQLRHKLGRSKKIFSSPVLRFIQMEEQLNHAFSASALEESVETESELDEDTASPFASKIP